MNRSRVLAVRGLRRVRDLPIRGKLILVAMVTSINSLLLACAAFLTYEMIAFRAGLVHDVSTSATRTAYYSSAALAFHDKAGATQMLGSLRTEPHIVAAAIYDENGSLFAEYRRDNEKSALHPATARPEGYQFRNGALEVFATIQYNQERLGTLYLQSDLDEMYARLGRYLAIVALVIAVACIVAYLLAKRLQRVISEPLSHLTGVVAVVARQRDFSVRASKHSEDELGQLIDGFNDMLSQIQARDEALQQAQNTLEARVQERTSELEREIVERKQAQVEVERVHRQLLIASREAGMSEIATNVLHNVGNVLNSVNVSAQMIADFVQRSKVAGLSKVAALLEEHQQDLGTWITTDARGKHLPPHLIALAKHLATERDAILAEVHALRGSVDHIKDIVATQQNYAKVSGLQEIVEVTELVEDSLRMNAGALTRHGIQLIREYRAQPRVNLDKHRVLQILVNLIRNAKYACDESGRSERQITLRVTTVDARVRILVIDNGVGIQPENLTRIFNHGFTTRAEGHGFGLHSGALTAQEVGGSLTAHSDGPGRGATFTLELPMLLEAEDTPEAAAEVLAS